MGKLRSSVFLILLFWIANACHFRKSVIARIFVKDSISITKKRNGNDFYKVFDRFYMDKEGRFFIKSFQNKPGKNDSLLLSEIFIEIPKLDSGSYVNYGSYIKDSSKVICVYDNSDGGNYLLLKNVDAKSFECFENVFGGKDKNHVFFQGSILYDLDVKKIKVYSMQRNCGNCEGYFTDGHLIYYGSKRISDVDFKIPNEYSVSE